MMPIDSLVPALRNPKRHELEQLRASYRRFGFTNPPILDERTGRLVAGHGRLQLLQIEQREGAEPPEGIEVEGDVWKVPVVRGWASANDAEAEAYLIADNRQAELGGWDTDLLGPMLDDLAALPELQLDGIGFALDDLPRLDDLVGSGFSGGGLGDGGDAGGGQPPSDGSLLALVDVTVGEPTHEVEPGDVYLIQDRHRLVIADVMTGWREWSKFLTDDALFVPYPGPYVALTKKAETVAMVLVQPERFIAGHILDKFAAVHGEDGIVKT
ncbi:MAG: hypothetical protein KGH75_00260 [Rhodospirillales bacterium]|nr:hypothetical protein [Rhodospirillales bacterium]